MTGRFPFTLKDAVLQLTPCRKDLMASHFFDASALSRETPSGTTTFFLRFLRLSIDTAEMLLRLTVDGDEAKGGFQCGISVRSAEVELRGSIFVYGPPRAHVVKKRRFISVTFVVHV